MSRIDIDEILNEETETPEIAEPFLTLQEDYESNFLKGNETFDGSNELYVFLENRAYALVDTAAYNALTRIGYRQLGMAEKYSSGIHNEIIDEEPTGRLIYTPAYYFKKAIQSQIFYWNKNNNIVDLNRARTIADSGTNYAEGTVGNETLFDELCAEAKTHIRNSGINTLIFEMNKAIEEGNEEQLVETLNTPGFVGMFKDGYGTDQIGLQELLGWIKELQDKFPSGEFAQTDAMVEDTTPFGDEGESLQSTNIRRDAQRDALIKTVDTLESQDNDSAVQREYPNNDIIISTGALPTHVPFTSDMVHEYVGVSTEGYLTLKQEMQQMFIQYSMDCTLSGLVDKDEHTLGVYVGIRDIETTGSLKLQLIKEKSITINKETSEVGTLDVAISGDWTVISKILLKNMGAGSPEDLERLEIGLFVLCTADITVNKGDNPTTDLLRGWAGNIVTVGKGVGDGLLLASTNLIDMPSDLVAKKTLVVNDDGDRYIYGNEHYVDPEDAANKIVSTDGAGKIPNNLIPTVPQFTAWQYGYGTPYANITDLVDAIPGDLASKVELIQDAGTPTITETYKLKLDGDPTEENHWLKVSETSPVDSVNSKTGVVQLDAIDIPYTDSTGLIGSTNTQGAITNLLVRVDGKKFIDSSDTPASYEGQSQKAVIVNTDETGLEFVEQPVVIEGDIVGEPRKNEITGEIEYRIRLPLIDDDIADEFLPWHTPVNKSIETPAGDIIYGDFVRLLDTPDNYVDQTGKFVVVKQDESGLEFIGINTVGLNSNDDGQVKIGKDSENTGTQGTAIGSSANNSGDRGTALGAYAVNSRDLGTALGANANNSGSRGTALGAYTNNSGDRGTALGAYTNNSSTQGTALGAYANNSGDRGTALGSYANNSSTQSMQLGSNNVLSQLSCRVALTVTSDKRDKANIKELDNTKALEFISKLKPATYNNATREIHKTSEEYGKAAKVGTRGRVGLIAQEVQETVKEIYGENVVDIVNDNHYDKVIDGVDQRLGINYQNIIPMLISSIQVLKEEIEELKKGKE